MASERHMPPRPSGARLRTSSPPAPPPLASIARLVTCGRFGDALSSLEELVPDWSHRQVVAVLKADLLERIGRHGLSRQTAEALLKSRDLTIVNRSVCE